MATGQTGQTDWSDQLAIRPSYTVWSVKVQCPADGTPVTEPTVSSGRRFGSERREGGREGELIGWDWLITACSPEKWEQLTYEAR